MKSIFFLIVFFSLTSNITIAQTKQFSLSVGPAYGLPLSKNYSNSFKNGIGGSFNANYKVTKLGSVTGSFTYLKSKSKIADSKGYDLFYLKLGYKTKFNKSNLFLQADAGIQGYSGSSPHFAVGTGIGYSFSFSPESAIDIYPTLNITMPSSINSVWLLFNATYRYTFKNPKK